MDNDPSDVDYLFDPSSAASIAVFTNTKFSLASKAGSEIKARFGGVKWLQNQGATPGSMLAVQHSIPGYPDTPFYVYYLVILTGSSTGPSDNNARSNALGAMITHAVEHGVTEIRMAFEMSRYLDATIRAAINTAFDDSGVTQTVINESSQQS